MEPDSKLREVSETPELIADRPDEWLLREWKAGDEQAAEVLFNRYAIRLVALVASRLNRRYQAAIDPSEVVQSAMGSFFNAAKHSRIQVSGSVSLWRLLATFARRKMARSIERHSASKRGGGQTQVSFDEIHALLISGPDDVSGSEADEFLSTLKMELTDDLFEVVEGLLAGRTQRELAESLEINERTVRRRLTRLREMLGPEGKTTNNTAPVASNPPRLPRVGYHEFVLGKLIGSGGFGKVYRASMQSDGRTVVVKFLRKAFWQNETARQSFLREINIASQINHPGIIRYLGYGESPHGGPYVISKWIDGRSLQTITHVMPQQAIELLKQICEAIQVVHDAGLVHGDLTPSNILVDAQDRITITDFGFSQAATNSASTVLGGTGVLGGTLGFAAPEQIDPAFGSISIKTDIYAIGGLLHWFLFGQPPNAGQSLEAALAQTLWHHDLDASGFDNIPQALRDILNATLRKSPSDRAKDVADVIRLLASDPSQPA